MTAFSFFLYSIFSACVGAFATIPPEHIIENRQVTGFTYLWPMSYDAFFRPPDNWTAYQPGDVLKLRENAYPTISVPSCTGTSQLLFRTSDTHRNASWGSATIFFPEGYQYCSESNATACPHGFVIYAVPYDSANYDASPSYLLQFGEPYGEMTEFLKRGWAVVAPDYEGWQASYCSGPQAAYSILDATRATLEVGERIGLRMDRIKYAIYGYSGGALAATFAAELAASYAPDLSLAGVVVGGPFPNLTTATLIMNGKDTAGLVVASTVGITAQWPAARQFLLSRLKTEGPYNATGFMYTLRLDGMGALYNYRDQNVFDYFIGGRDDYLNPTLQDVFDKEAASGYHGTPNMPVFICKAVNDELSPVNETDELYNKYCDNGANVLYHRNTIGGHNAELWMARPRAMSYLEVILNGAGNISIPETGCQTVNVSVPVNLEVALGSGVPLPPILGGPKITPRLPTMRSAVPPTSTPLVATTQASSQAPTQVSVIPTATTTVS